MQLDETVRLLDRLNRSHGHRLPEKQVARVEPRSDSPTVESDSIRQYSDSLTVRQSAQSDSPTRSKSTVQYSVGPTVCRVPTIRIMCVLFMVVDVHEFNT